MTKVYVLTCEQAYANSYGLHGAYTDRREAADAFLADPSDMHLYECDGEDVRQVTYEYDLHDRDRLERLEAWVQTGVMP